MIMTQNSHDNIAVEHEPEQSRFALYKDGELGGFASYVERGQSREFNHTVVESAFRGQGLSKRLIKHALDASHADGFSILPTCSAVKDFIAKNPEYQEVVI
ncbi:Acetyltransferase [Corynebacterium pseudotuberculosis]|nr:Acetyltransferase [Corynebacterium pseudotuberculosis]